MQIHVFLQYTEMYRVFSTKCFFLSGCIRGLHILLKKGTLNNYSITPGQEYQEYQTACFGMIVNQFHLL